VLVAQRSITIIPALVISNRRRASRERSPKRQQYQDHARQEALRHKASLPTGTNETKGF
jgi:hypothetical protein